MDFWFSRKGRLTMCALWDETEFSRWFTSSQRGIDHYTCHLKTPSASSFGGISFLKIVRMHTADQHHSLKSICADKYVFMPLQPRPSGGIEHSGFPYMCMSSVDQVNIFAQGRISRPVNGSKLIFHMIQCDMGHWPIPVNFLKISWGRKRGNDHFQRTF